MSENKTDFDAEIERLGPAGKQTYQWMRELGGESIDDVLPLAVRTCELAQRISDLWKKIDQAGVINGRGQRNPLLSVVIALEKVFSANWKTLGLADKDAEGKGRVGRPPGGGGDKASQFPFGHV